VDEVEETVACDAERLRDQADDFFRRHGVVLHAQLRFSLGLRMELSFTVRWRRFYARYRHLSRK